MVIDELGMIHDSPRSTVSQQEENELLEALALSLSLVSDDSHPPPAVARPKPRPPTPPFGESTRFRPPPLFRPDSPQVRPVVRDIRDIPYLARPPVSPRPAPPAAVPSAAAFRAARQHFSPPRERLYCFPAASAAYGRPSHGQLMRFEAARSSAEFDSDTDDDSQADDALSNASTASSVHRP